MLSLFRVSTTLPRKLEELGVSPALVLRRAGLQPGLFDQEKILVSTEDLFAFYRGLAEASSDPAIGLKLGTEDRVERYEPITLAAVSARSLRDALQRLEFCGATKNRKMYEAHFRCPARFDARRNTIVFRKADLDRPFITHNADLFAAVAPQLEAELAQALASKTISEQVKGVLKRLLAGRRPGIEDVASELHVSSRTLQRRLTEAGVTFQQLMQEARRELARHYLKHSSLELNQTAYLLGYEDAHSFFRAFHGWEGSSPGEWRARHARSPRARSGAPAV